MVGEVCLEKTRRVSSCGPVLVRLAGERGSVSDCDHQHLHADEQVLNALLDVVGRPAAHLVDEVDLHQAGNHDTLVAFAKKQGKNKKEAWSFFEFPCC